ncbi:hypothetical protein JCM1840_002092 [Sporobolomyces johnsonii]
MVNPPALPSLLRNLTSSSQSRAPSTASISLDLPITNDDDDQRSLSTRRVVTSPAPAPDRTSPAVRRRWSNWSLSPRPSPTPSSLSSAPPPAPLPTPHASADDRASVRSRSSASSSSSFEGLTARLQGARQGKASLGLDQGNARSTGHREETLTQPDPGASATTLRAEGSERGDDEHGETLATARAPEEPPTDATHSLLPRSTTVAAVPAVADDFSAGPSHSPSFASRSTSPHLPPEPSSTSLDLDAAFASLHSGSAYDSDEDGDDASSLLVAHYEGQLDPREMLRAQLAKASAQPGEAGRGKVGGEEAREATRKGNLSRTGSGISAGASSERQGRDVDRAYQRRRYFILSTAGKLVYTSDDDEEAATGLVGVMQAIVSIFADEGDKIRYVDVGPTRISLLLKAPLYLVVSSNWGEPESVLRAHLDYLYFQVLSVVTLAQLQSIFSRRSNFDLRRMMEGTEPFFHSLVDTLQTSIPILTSSIEVYRLDPHLRSEIAKALDPGKETTRRLDLLYVLLLAHGRLVTLLRPKKHSIHPTDLHLLLSTIYSTSSSRSLPSSSSSPPLSPDLSDPSLPTQPRRRSSPLTEPGLESWLPICLPRFNPRGFLHAYVSFLPSSSSSSEGGTGLVLLSSERDAFVGVKDAAEGIKERLLGGPSASGHAKEKKGKVHHKGGKAAGGLVHEVEMARSGQEYSLGELAIPGLRHFVYKSRALVQVTRPAWEGDYLSSSQAQYRLITLYQTVYESLHPRPAQSGSGVRNPAQVQYVRTEHEAVLGWVTAQFELYVATSPLLPHSAVVSAARAVSRWVKNEEERLFLTSSPSF